MAQSSSRTTQIVSSLCFIVAHCRPDYASTDSIKSLESWWKYFIFGADATDIYAATLVSEHLFTESNDALSKSFKPRVRTKWIRDYRFAVHLKKMLYAKLRIRTPAE